MNSRASMGIALVAAALVGSIHAAEPGAADRVSAFYVGNWMQESAMPFFHPALGKSAGKEWNVASMAGYRHTLYMNLYAFKNDWTFNDRSTWSSFGVKPLKDVFTGNAWKALVVQPYGWMGLHRSKPEMGNWATEELAKTLGTDDFGDVASIVAIYELFHKQHPGIELLVFQSWPELEIKRGSDGVPLEEETAAGPDLAPDREGFDYVKHWETVRYQPELKEEGHTWQTRDYSEQLMKELAERLPDQAKAGKLRCIPVGEVYNSLEKKIRAGSLPGIKSVTSFYSDRGHLRMGLPRHLAAATCYAVLFNDKPHGLDWSGYNDPKAYRSINWPFTPHEPHLGALIPITPELATTVNDTVWEVASKHPHTNIK